MLSYQSQFEMPLSTSDKPTGFLEIRQSVTKGMIADVRPTVEKMMEIELGKRLMRLILSGRDFKFAPYRDQWDGDAAKQEDRMRFFGKVYLTLGVLVAWRRFEDAGVGECVMLGGTYYGVPLDDPILPSQIYLPYGAEFRRHEPTSGRPGAWVRVK